MTRSSLIAVPLLLLACDRPPTAPDAPAAAAFAATSEWIPWEIAFPPAGVDFGVIACLGQQAQAYGGVSGRSRWVTRPDGSVMEKWWTLELWEDYHLVIGGETWRPIAHRARSGVTQYDESGASLPTTASARCSRSRTRSPVRCWTGPAIGSSRPTRTASYGWSSSITVARSATEPRRAMGPGSESYAFRYATSFDAFQFFSLEDPGREWPTLPIAYR